MPIPSDCGHAVTELSAVTVLMFLYNLLKSRRERP